jgi:hypothetical protein
MDDCLRWHRSEVALLSGVLVGHRERPHVKMLTGVGWCISRRSVMGSAFAC